MDYSHLNQLGVAAALLVFTLAGIVLPTLRMRRRAGHTGYVAHRPPSAVHQLAIDGLRFSTIGIVAWSVSYVVLGESLGLYRVPLSMTFLGWAFIACGMAAVLVAQVQMGASWRIGIDAKERTELVTGGLFRWVRNPIFSGMLLVTLGIVVITPSPWSLMGWLFFLYVLALQVRLEEEHLLNLHGATYRQYAERVGRFVPVIGRLPGRHEERKEPAHG